MPATTLSTAWIAAFVSLFTDIRAKTEEFAIAASAPRDELQEVNYMLDLLGVHLDPSSYLPDAARSHMTELVAIDRTIEGLADLHAGFLKLFWLRGASENDLKKEFNEFSYLV